MSATQLAIEDAVIDILAHTAPCTMDEVVKSLPAYDWSEIFSAVDEMSRDGRLVIRRPSSSVYQLSLSVSRSRRRNNTERIKPSPVRFCVGCGYLCDEVELADGQATWGQAHRYLKKYRLTWVELDRNDGFCPACARVFACARHRPLSSP